MTESLIIPLLALKFLHYSAEDRAIVAQVTIGLDWLNLILFANLQNVIVNYKQSRGCKVQHGKVINSIAITMCGVRWVLDLLG